MQILQKLFNVADEQPRQPTTATTNGQKAAKSKVVVCFRNCKANRGLKRSVEANLRHPKVNPVTIFALRRDVAKTCFYSTVNLTKLGSFNRRQSRIYSMKMKKEGIARGLGMGNKADTAAGSRVLPISEPASSAQGKKEQREIEEKRDEPAKGERSRNNSRSSSSSSSRMKELLRWAAAAKSERGGNYLGRKVLQLRNRARFARLKAVPDDDQFSNESPKISFRWEVESCSTTSSVCSAISMASSHSKINILNDQPIDLSSLSSTPLHDLEFGSSRRGNWITTDSDFVVLEL